MSKVKPMESARTGQPVRNQYVIYSDDFEVVTFQSYDSTICEYHKGAGKVYLDPYYYNYSVTTTKYLHKFLREECTAMCAFTGPLTTKRIEKLCEEGEDSNWVWLDLN
jgi:hypothetical protein